MFHTTVGALGTHTWLCLICIAFQDRCLCLLFREEETEIQGPGHLCKITQLVNVSVKIWTCGHGRDMLWRVGKLWMVRGQRTPIYRGPALQFWGDSLPLHTYLHTTPDDRLLNVECVWLSQQREPYGRDFLCHRHAASHGLRRLFVLTHEPMAHLTELAFVTWAPWKNYLLGPSPL